jgi:hypothetical protein
MLLSSQQKICLLLRDHLLLLSSVMQVDTHTHTHTQTHRSRHAHGEGNKKAKTLQSALNYEENKIICNALMTDDHVNYSHMVQRGSC